MTVVVDSSLLIALATTDPRALAVERLVRDWLTEGEEIAAPELALYEIANAFTRLIVAGRLPLADLEEAWRRVGQIPLHSHSLTDGRAVVDVALRLGRQSAYDAAYLVLAQQLGAELWTLDGPLYRNASERGLPVRLVQ
jgi:predicted nucleic acid-binding protein